MRAINIAGIFLALGASKAQKTVELERTVGRQLAAANFPAELFQYSGVTTGEFCRFHFANPIPPSRVSIHTRSLLSSCVVPCFAFLFELQRQSQLLTFPEPFLSFLSSPAPPFARKRRRDERREGDRRRRFPKFRPAPPRPRENKASFFCVSSGPSERKLCSVLDGLIDIPFFHPSSAPPPSSVHVESCVLQVDPIPPTNTLSVITYV